MPTVLKRVGKIIFFLVPTWLLGPTLLLNSKKLSRLHAYLAVTLIRQLRVSTCLVECINFPNFVRFRFCERGRAEGERKSGFMGK